MRYLDQKLDIKEKQNMDIKLPQNGPKWALPKKCINYGSGHLHDASHQGDVVCVCDVPFLNDSAPK